MSRGRQLRQPSEKMHRGTFTYIYILSFHNLSLTSELTASTAASQSLQHICWAGLRLPHPHPEIIRQHSQNHSSSHSPWPESHPICTLCISSNVQPLHQHQRRGSYFEQIDTKGNFRIRLLPSKQPDEATFSSPYQ